MKRGFFRSAFCWVGLALHVTLLPADERIDHAIAGGVGFLLADQNPNGSWGSAHQTKGTQCSGPGSSRRLPSGGDRDGDLGPL